MTGRTKVQQEPNRTREIAEYRLAMAAGFLVFLAVAAARRLTPRRWRADTGAAGKRRSLFAEARAAANNWIPFCFMG